MRILQEVLMALAGHPGDLFVLEDDGMQCSDDVGGLNESEKASLDRVVRFFFFFFTSLVWFSTIVHE